MTINPHRILLPSLLALASCLAPVSTLWAQASAPAEILIDSADSQSVKTGGKVTATKKVGKPEDILTAIGGSSLTTGAYSKPNPGNAKIIVTPQIPADGEYAVYARWLAPAMFFGLSAKTPATLTYANGSLDFSVNHQAGNEWIFFGIYPFKKGDSATLTFSDANTVGLINFDAAKWVPAKLQPTKPAKNLPPTDGKQDAFDAVRLKLADMLTTPLDTDENDPEIDPKLRAADFDAHAWWTLLNRSPDAKLLWSDTRPTDGTGGDNVWLPYRRVNAMARAYVRTSNKYGFGQEMQGNEKLRDDILYALEWLNKNSFNETTKNPAGAAWFANEIGIPRDMCEAILLMYPHIKPEQRARYMIAVENMTRDPRKFYIKSFPSTGANRVWLCYVHVLRGLIEKDDARIKLSVDALDDPLSVIVRSQALGSDGKTLKGKTTDGFYADGSFIQHGHLPYTTGYGNSMLNSFAKLVALLNETPWEVTNPKRANIASWVYNGIEPMIYRGDAFPRLMGRGVSMQQGQNYGGGVALRTVLANLIPAMPPEDAARFSSLLKAWTLDDVYERPVAGQKKKIAPLDIDLIARTKHILADNSIKPASRTIQSRVFANMDFVVHHRPDFAAALSMSSTRIATHECIWTANRRGWYQGDGMLMVYVPDPSRFNDGYWPTVNPYRLPGITVDTQPRKDGEDGGANSGALSKSPWAGGVELSRRAASASMILQAQQSSLTARKSWFFFGDEIICLGSGITASDDRTIETIIENAKLNAVGDNALIVNGTAQPISLDWKASLPDVRWINVAGSAKGADIGYLFPQPTTLQALREARTATWQDLYKLNDLLPVTKNYLTLFIDHGKNPANASYAYAILPGKSADQTQALAAKPPFEILAHTADVHAVRSPSLGLLGINFFADKPPETAGVTANGKCGVILEEKEKQLIIALSDPTQLATSIEITFSSSATKSLTIDPAIKILSLSPIKFTVDLAKSDGRTFTATFEK